MFTLNSRALVGPEENFAPSQSSKVTIVRRAVALESGDLGGVSLQSVGKWSGLSESNRHLNLGKVPYYHYTKAAQLHFFL
jgi:hypothetical protein